jgi:hypothetical protein
MLLPVTNAAAVSAANPAAAIAAAAGHSAHRHLRAEADWTRDGQSGTATLEIFGTYLTGAIDAGPLELGGATFTALQFAVIPRARGGPFDIVLGSDVLAALSLTIEAERHRVRVAPAGIAGNGTPITLDFPGGRPVAQVRLGQRDQSEPMLVDTGDSALISIGYDEYREDPGLFAVRGSSSAAGIAGLPMDTLDGSLGRAEIGSRTLDDVPVRAVRGQRTGHVGYGLAARCAALTLDLGRSRIVCGGAAGEP